MWAVTIVEKGGTMGGGAASLFGGLCSLSGASSSLKFVFIVARVVLINGGCDYCWSGSDHC